MQLCVKNVAAAGIGLHVDITARVFSYCDLWLMLSVLSTTTEILYRPPSRRDNTFGSMHVFD